LYQLDSHRVRILISKKHEWRWGTHGSLSLSIAGATRGKWYDHERGEGGDALSLIVQRLGIDIRAAIEWAERWLGLEAQSGARKQSAEPKPVSRTEKAETPAERVTQTGRRTADALRLFHEGYGLANTPAEAYLASRQLKAPPDAPIR
jgi:hypothetical protein